MKYTHRDIEADKRKPVGSLFMSLMDRDSMPPRVHQNKYARGIYNRSLPNTPFSMYGDEPGRTRTPELGRRRFPEHNEGQYTRENSETHVEEAQRAQTALRHRQALRSTLQNPDHLGSNLIPKHREVSPVRQKRYLREPGGDGGTPMRLRLAGGSRNRDEGHATPLRQRPHSAQGRDHLGLHTLIPREEPPKARPVPPPMILTPRKTGIRLFPEKRSASVGDHGTGVKMVHAPPHWRSVTDRQWDFLELGVDAKTSAAPRYRNQSSVGVGGAPVVERNRNAATPGPGQERQQRGRPAASVLRWRGRGSSATPERRSFDIITGRPARY